MVHVLPYAELQENLAASREILEAVYADPIMNRTCYQLHAVLVHQGQASGGHYWAYVKKAASTAHDIHQMSGHGSKTTTEGHNHPLSATKPQLSRTTDHTHADLQLPNQSSDAVMSLQEDVGKPEGDEKTVSGSEGKVMAAAEGSGNEVEDMPCSDEALVMSPPDAMEQGSVGSKAEEDDATGVEATMSDQTDWGPKKCPNQENSPQGDVWLKFNDISVTEVTWEEVKRESFGSNSQGIGNTSAYCLMYVSQQSTQLWTRLTGKLLLHMYAYLSLGLSLSGKVLGSIRASCSCTHTCTFSLH